MARGLRALPFVLLCLALARSAWAAPPTITIEELEDGDPIAFEATVAGKITGTSPVTVKLRVDAGPEVAATVVNSGYVGQVTLTTEGAHTITATATNAEDSASASVMVIGDDTPPEVIVSAPTTGFITGDVTIDVTATVTDTHLDPNDPNTLFVNGAQVLVDPNTGIFHGRVPAGVGSNALAIRARDRAGNVTNDPNNISVTRTRVCQDPTVPATANNDPNKPHSIVVDRLDDLPIPAGFDPNAPGPCDIRPDIRPDDPNDETDPFVPRAGRCTLRGALQVANAHPGVDVIRLPNDTIVLTRRGAGEDAGLHGDLDVTDDLVVVGRSRDTSVIDARKLKDRVFDVAEGASFTIFSATVRGGQTPKKPAESGGCIRFAGGLDDANDPNSLATFRANNLAMLDCKSSANGGSLDLNQDPNAPLPVLPTNPNANDPNGISKITCGIVARSSAKGDGGGINSEGGVLVLRNSTIAFASSGAAGGGLSVFGGKTAIRNTTFSANKAKRGGGLALAGGAGVTVNNTTFAQNKAKLGTSLSTSDGAGGANTLDVSNSILGDKPKGACDSPATAPVEDRGGNLDPGVTCELAEADSDANPLLDKLATNIGVPTHALKPNSPAIDRGIFAMCEPLDERDADRVDGPPVDTDPPDDDVCDSGSFEFASPAPPPPEPKKP